MNNDNISTLTVAFCASLMIVSLMISAIAIEKAETAIKLAKKSDVRSSSLEHKFNCQGDECDSANKKTSKR